MIFPFSFSKKKGRKSRSALSKINVRFLSISRWDLGDSGDQIDRDEVRRKVRRSKNGWITFAVIKVQSNRLRITRERERESIVGIEKIESSVNEREKFVGDPLH